MNRTIVIASMTCGLFLTATAAFAARPSPVQACAIIHAVYLAKKAQIDDKAAANYCKKLKPGAVDRDGADIDDKNRARLVASVSKRQSSLGVSSNRKISRIKDADGNVVGDAECDPDVASTLPKQESIAVLAADIDAYLLNAETFCDERF